MRRLWLFLFLLINVSCEDLGTNPWEGWQTKHLWSLTLSLPPDVSEPWGDPNPPPPTKFWMSRELLIILVYGPGQDSSIIEPHLRYPRAKVDDIFVGKYPAKRLAYTALPQDSTGWDAMLKVFLPYAGNGQNQVSLSVLYDGEKSIPELIVRSLRVNDHGPQ